MTTMLADDDPASTGRLIQHFSSESSNTRFVLDNLSNVIDIVPKAIKLSCVSTLTVEMIADNNLVSMAQAASLPLDNMAAISSLVDDEIMTITTAAESLDDTGIIATEEGEPKMRLQETSDLEFAWKNTYSSETSA